MAKIYRNTDRIPVRIDDVVVKFAPMSLSVKSEVQALVLKGRENKDIKASTDGIALALKSCVKSVDGIEDMDGNPYKLQFTDGQLTDECLDDLLNLEISNKLQAVCLSFINGVHKQFMDLRGQLLEGVEFVGQEVEEKKT